MPSAASARAPGARRRPDRRGRGHPRRDRPGHGRRRPRQHRLPAPVRGRAGDRPRRRGDAARRRAARSPSSRPASTTSRARSARSPPGVALRVVAERKRTRPQRPPRGAVRRARRRAAPAQGPVPRHRPREARPPRLDHRPGRHRQEPARLGVPQVRRRRRRRRPVARRPLARLRRGRHVLGARRDGPSRAPASLETDDAETTRAKVAEMLATHVPDEARARAGSSRRCWPCSASATRRPAAATSCSGRGGRSSSGSPPTGTVAPPVRGPPLGRPGPLDFIDHVLEWSRGVPILIITLARPELLERRPDWGAGRRNFLALDLEPLTETAMRELLTGLVPGLPPRRRARSSLAPTASRCTRSRPSGCSSPTAGCARPTAATSRSASSASWPCPRRSRPSSRRASTASSRPTGRSSRTPRCSARASRWTGLAAVSGEEPIRARRRGCAPWPRRELRHPGVDPRSPERGHVRVRPGAHPRGRLRHAGQARPARAPPGRGPLLRGARRGRAGRRARRPLRRGLARRSGGSGGRGRGRPGTARARRGGRSGPRPRVTRAGRRLPRAGAPGHRPIQPNERRSSSAPGGPRQRGPDGRGRGVPARGRSRSGASIGRRRPPVYQSTASLAAALIIGRRLEDAGVAPRTGRRGAEGVADDATSRRS